MKRKTIMVLAVLVVAFACLFTSCSGSVEPPRAEEYGYVTFGNGSSRTLSTEYGIKSYDDLKWFYTSRKMDSYGLTGATDTETAVPAKSNGKGIGSGSVGPFSQGAWQFTLYAYETTGTTSTLVYQGTSSTVILKGGETKAVPVSVSLMGNTGFVDLSMAFFQWKDRLSTSDGNVYAEFKLVGETDVEGDGTLNATTVVGPIKASESYKIGSLLSVNGSTDVPVGYYTCTVKAYLGKDVTTDESGVHHVSVEADPVVTQVFGLRVYGNATTYVKGNLVESPDTYVEFSVPDQTMVAFNSNLAEVPSNPVGTGATQKTTVNFGSNIDSNATYLLSLETADFDTSSAKFTVSDDESAVASISFDLTKITSSESGTSQTTVDTFDEAITVTTYIATGLTNVQVKYNGAGSDPDRINVTTSTSPVSGNYYESDTGKLVFSTTHFSEYYVIADKVVAFNNDSNRASSTLKDAVDNASEGNTIVLKRDITLNETVKVEKGITIDLDGYSITGNNVRALQFASGASRIAGVGIVKVEGDTISEGSSVIRIGDGSTWSVPGTTAVELTIDENVTVETDVCYAVSVFGSLTKESLVIKGSLFGKYGLGTNGRENTSDYSPIITLESSAEIRSSEGYALYLPAAGSYTINGIVEGPGAICTKAGNLTVAIGDGAVITATGEAGIEIEEGNSNGSATKNYAVVVENNSAYGGPAHVVINGGLITGTIGVYNDSTNVPSDDQKGTIVVTGGTFSSDPSEYIQEGCEVVEVEGMYEVVGDTAVIKKAAELKAILTAFTDAGSGNATVSIEADIRLADGETWTPVTVDGYHGAGVITVKGNGHTISGLNAPLFAGGFAGESGIVIKDLTLENTTIVDNTNSLGIGAFINSIDSMPTIELNNCHLKNSSITSTAGARVGGLIGWTSGYNNPDDGPVDTYVTITSCSVEDCTITAAGSVGAIIGHAGSNPATNHTITGCTVTGTTLNSTDDGDWRVGVVVGTANIGEVNISGTTESSNTLTQTGKTAPEHSNLYGRFVPDSTGKLTIDDVEIE